MLDVLGESVKSETLDAHIARIFDTYAAADRVWKNLPTSSSFMWLIMMFVWRRTDMAIADPGAGHPPYDVI